MSATTKFNVARALALLGVIGLGLGAILSIPRASAAAERAPLDIALVDVSKSVVARAGGEWGSSTAVRLSEWARRAQASGHDVALVAFGREIRVVFTAQPADTLAAAFATRKLVPARDLLEVDGREGARHTRLAAALSMARSLGQERSPSSITIFGDGTFTGEDPTRIAHELAGDGFEIALVSEPPRAANLALSSLDIARELEVGAPIVVSALVRVDRGTPAGGRAHVAFEVRDAGGVRTQRVDFETGDRDLVPLHVELGAARAGLVRIEAAVAFDDRVLDVIAEDDRSATVLRCAGSLVVGELGSPNEGDTRPWSISGIEFVPIEPGRLASEIVHLDALVTHDAQQTHDAQRAIRGFVAQGGGWLDLAGQHWIRERLQRNNPLHDLGALVPDHEPRQREVIFLIDASGSMAGPPFDAVRAHIGALVDGALPDDDVSVRFFAEDVSPPIRFGTSAQRTDPARRSALDESVRTARSPGGSTRILAALETLARERAGSGREALVLLLSDGRDVQEPDQQDRIERWNSSRAAARMRVVAVAPVVDVDREFLTRASDAFVDLDDPTRWPDVFRREMLEQEIVRRKGLPVVPVVGGLEPASTLAAALHDLPPIDAHVRADVALGAQIILTDDHGTPLAAFARRGSGRVAALAFEPGSSWAPAWTRSKPLAPIVRALARSERSRLPSVRVEGDSLVLENVGSSFPAAAHAVIDVDEGDDIELTFTADARGVDSLSTRTAPLPRELDEQSGIAFVRVDGGDVGDLDLALERPRASEFAFAPRRFSPPAPRLDTGRVNTGKQAHHLAPPSLALGVCALAAAAVLGAFSARRR